MSLFTFVIPVLNKRIIKTDQSVFIVRKDKPFQIITKEKVFKCKANVPFTLEKCGFKRREAVIVFEKAVLQRSFLWNFRTIAG
jgi:hypothetical protein